MEDEMRRRHATLTDMRPDLSELSTFVPILKIWQLLRMSDASSSSQASTFAVRADQQLSSD
jgi:hypothetical protein